jgi:metal-dependent hydrolase (beta-lactamase superfamily II)
VEALSGKPKITCIVDNAVQSGSRLWGEHGLAFLVEIGDGRVLFDAGQSGTVLLHNLAVLGVDPATIDALAISHAHYDHTGGLPALLERTHPISSGNDSRGAESGSSSSACRWRGKRWRRGRCCA